MELDRHERIRVAAAVIAKGDQLLLGLRPADKRYAGLWEFPGGKVQSGESVTEALRREVLEELGVNTNLIGEVLFSADDPGSQFVIEFLFTSISGEPKPLAHQDLTWVSVINLLALPLAPCDRLFAEYVISSGLINYLGSAQG